MANPDIPLCDLASLNWVSHRVPSSPAFEYQVRKSEKTTEQEVLHLYRCFTHTLPWQGLFYPEDMRDVNWKVAVWLRYSGIATCIGSTMLPQKDHLVGQELEEHQ